MSEQAALPPTPYRKREKTPAQLAQFEEVKRKRAHLLAERRAVLFLEAQKRKEQEQSADALIAGEESSSQENGMSSKPQLTFTDPVVAQKETNHNPATLYAHHQQLWQHVHNLKEVELERARRELEELKRGRSGKKKRASRRRRYSDSEGSEEEDEESESEEEERPKKRSSKKKGLNDIVREELWKLQSEQRARPPPYPQIPQQQGLRAPPPRFSHSSVERQSLGSTVNGPYPPQPTPPPPQPQQLPPNPSVPRRPASLADFAWRPTAA